MKTEGEYIELVNQALEPCLKDLGTIPKALLDAMLYSLMAGGKRFRPTLLLAACDLVGGDLQAALPFACALEMVHTYSLIHDDLPGMDNDDMRRGRPTNHRVFGEGMAILAGDGLLNAAMEIMLKASLQMDDLRGVRATEILARHAGVTGMIAGQTLDITMEGETPDQNTVQYIHMHKTADLIQAPVEMGLVLGGCDSALVEAGRSYGFHLGIAFQIVDDLLDATGDAKLLGKNTGMDTDKMTWVALRGVDQSRLDAEWHCGQALEALSSFSVDCSFFRNLAMESLERVR